MWQLTNVQEEKKYEKKTYSFYTLIKKQYQNIAA